MRLHCAAYCTVREQIEMWKTALLPWAFALPAPFHLRQARLDSNRIARNLVAAVAAHVGRLQAVMRAGGGRNRDDRVGRVDQLPAPGIARRPAENETAVAGAR